ncbi:MAG: hypothetical protein J7496_14760 [Novosphingobium sp.]|nr:hypothetical protein [Novosphingobium sp.]
MGIIMGKLLQAGGARISYLVRPNRLERLSRPQVLYSFDDHRLTHFTGYEILTDPGRIERDAYDYVIFTIDGIALRSVEGQALVRQVGEIARGTHTKVLIGTMGVDLRRNFLSLSGLDPSQVFNGGLYILVYQADRVTLPLHPPTDAGLLAQADFAHRQAAPMGFFVDESAPEAARAFAGLWEASGESQCVVLSEEAFSTQVPAVFALFVACDIMGWPSWRDMHTDPGLWELAAEATREIQGLSINGETGQQARQATTAQGLIDMWRALEEETLPADLLEFNRFHHGGKVYEQDVELLRDCAALGHAEGKSMAALEQLIERSRAARRERGSR